MIKLLDKAEPADFQFIIKTLDSWVSFTDDSELMKLYSAFEKNPAHGTRHALAAKIDKEIRYVGSADVAYLIRWIFSDEPGVKADEIVSDVSEKLKVSHKAVGSIEARLERLVKNAVEKQIFSMKPEEQKKFFEQHNVGPEAIEELMRHLREKGKVVILPLIMQLVGAEITIKIIQEITVSIIASLIGREAAKQLFKQIAQRFPWWGEWLGPVIWTITLGWLALDLQGPAYRKTVPITLYLGLIGLRDGPADGDAFWAAE